MPVRVVKIKGKCRLVGPNGKIEKTKNGKPRDGGGGNCRKVHIQAAIINGKWKPK